ncbi:MAG: hypothetical protein GY937_10515 [bacterium]|nr:hypothetical protein [bacterium]
MSTTLVTLDLSQYVRVTSNPASSTGMLIQSMRDSVRVTFSATQPARANPVYHVLGGDDPILQLDMVTTHVWVLAMSTQSAVAVTMLGAYTPIQKFGERKDMGDTAAGEDICMFNKLSPAPTSTTEVPTPASAGEQMTFVCESDDDAAGGIGAQAVRFDYLDGAGAAQQLTMATAGQTPVDLSVSDVRYINNFSVAGLGTSSVAIGHIKVYRKTDDGRVYNMIAAGGNQSMVPHYMVPMGKTLHVRGWHCGETQNRRVNLRIRSTDLQGEITDGVYLFKDVEYIRNNPTGEMLLDYFAPELSITKVSGWPESAGSEVGCSWHARLYDYA